MDVMTTVAWRSTGWPRGRVVGCGALLDSMRLRAILADRFRVPTADVEATVLGEHGERAVPVFSRATIRGRPAVLRPKERREIEREVRDVSVRIIEAKGGTAFGPAGTTADLLRALFGSAPSVVPCSVVLEGESGVRGVAIGVPALLARGRVERVDEWPLSDDERRGMARAAKDLAAYVEDAAVVLDWVPTVRGFPSTASTS